MSSRAAPRTSPACCAARVEQLSAGDHLYVGLEQPGPGTYGKACANRAPAEGPIGYPAGRGRRTVKVDPRSSLLLAATDPPMAITRLRTMWRPSPIPAVSPTASLPPRWN